jgi:hypothetical protein
VALDPAVKRLHRQEFIEGRPLSLAEDSDMNLKWSGSYPCSSASRASSEPCIRVPAMSTTGCQRWLYCDLDSLTSTFRRRTHDSEHITFGLSMTCSPQGSSFRILIFTDHHNLSEIAANHQENTKLENLIFLIVAQASSHGAEMAVVA